MVALAPSSKNKSPLKQTGRRKTKMFMQRIIAALIISVALCACGQKGSLYMQQPGATTTVVTSPQSGVQESGEQNSGEQAGKEEVESEPSSEELTEDKDKKQEQ
jgi:predicted small lipoprotein YifL